MTPEDLISKLRAALTEAGQDRLLSIIDNNRAVMMGVAQVAIDKRDVARLRAAFLAVSDRISALKTDREWGKYQGRLANTREGLMYAWKKTPGSRSAKSAATALRRHPDFEPPAGYTGAATGLVADLLADFAEHVPSSNLIDPIDLAWAVERAFGAPRAEDASNRHIWTNAPREYDMGGTVEVGSETIDGQPWRHVVTSAYGQDARYKSGLYEVSGTKPSKSTPTIPPAIKIVHGDLSDFAGGARQVFKFDIVAQGNQRSTVTVVVPHGYGSDTAVKLMNNHFKNLGLAFEILDGDMEDSIQADFEYVLSSFPDLSWEWVDGMKHTVSLTDHEGHLGSIQWIRQVFRIRPSTGGPLTAKTVAEVKAWLRKNVRTMPLTVVPQFDDWAHIDDAIDAWEALTETEEATMSEGMRRGRVSAATRERANRAIDAHREFGEALQQTSIVIDLIMQSMGDEVERSTRRDLAKRLYMALYLPWESSKDLPREKRLGTLEHHASTILKGWKSIPKSASRNIAAEFMHRDPSGLVNPYGSDPVLTSGGGVAAKVTETRSDGRRKGGPRPGGLRSKSGPTIAVDAVADPHGGARARVQWLDSIGTDGRQTREPWLTSGTRPTGDGWKLFRDRAVAADRTGEVPIDIDYLFSLEDTPDHYSRIEVLRQASERGMADDKPGLQWLQSRYTEMRTDLERAFNAARISPSNGNMTGTGQAIEILKGRIPAIMGEFDLSVYSRKILDGRNLAIDWYRLKPGEQAANGIKQNAQGFRISVAGKNAKDWTGDNDPTGQLTVDVLGVYGDWRPVGGFPKFRKYTPRTKGTQALNDVVNKILEWFQTNADVLRGTVAASLSEEELDALPIGAVVHISGKRGVNKGKPIVAKKTRSTDRTASPPTFANWRLFWTSAAEMKRFESKGDSGQREIDNVGTVGIAGKGYVKVLWMPKGLATNREAMDNMYQTRSRIRRKLLQDDKLVRQAQVNTFNNFMLVAKDRIADVAADLDKAIGNAAVATIFSNFDMFAEDLGDEIYKEARKLPPVGPTTPIQAARANARARVAQLPLAGRWYKQRFRDGSEIYFVSTSTLKNGNTRGFMYDPQDRRTAPKQTSVDKRDIPTYANSGTIWKQIDPNDLPQDILDRFAKVVDFEMPEDDEEAAREAGVSGPRVVTDADLDAFVARVQEVVHGDTTVGYKPGRSKYVRIVKTLGNGQRSVYGFVERADGTLWKAKSWKAPTFNKSRGNLFDPEYIPDPYSIS